MRLTHTEAMVRIPGNPAATKRSSAEWLCPDCDYFEEAEKEKA